MIRRDYILRMIEEFFQALARINALKRGQLWQEAAERVDEEFNRLIRTRAPEVAQLSETQLLARLTDSESTQAVRHKTLMLTALLKEAGDVAAAQNLTEESRACYLKGLHLLLETLARGEVAELPEFVPTIEVFVAALRDSGLPARTQVLLMRHYEQTGEFAKAEDALFSMLEGEPQNTAIVDFGIAFYERLQGHSDAALTAGNLPRTELVAGLAELRRRKDRGF